ncbi:MAG: SUMF1/EgtB/PvdO family nonheme iron enzyme [Phycisphaerae bacterium]|nr:SUMF1/EgtB/PvdO family nonheme iron enzyme [Phycisphaerae bacterium]
MLWRSVLVLFVLGLSVCAAGGGAGFLRPDINDDGVVDLADLKLLGEGWLGDDCESSNDWCTRGDLNKDGRVDGSDLALMAETWGTEEAPIEEGFESGDFTYLDWRHSGDASWVVVSDVRHAGVYSARSGVIGHKQQSTLELTLETSFTEISFYCKTSSEGGDHLRFYINDVEVGAWSGDRDWVRSPFFMTPGRHTFKWSYTKDFTGSQGLDCAWIDRIVMRRIDPVEMIEIAGGTFEMGDSLGEGPVHELPVHTVTLSSFHLSAHLITKSQYCQFLNRALREGQITMSGDVAYKAGSGTSYPYIDTYWQYRFYNTFRLWNPLGQDQSNHPVERVTWYGAAAYCNWLSEQEGREPCYDLSTWECDFGKNGYRLPTEAQWEYAARGGLAGKRFPWGDLITHNEANYTSDAIYSYDISATRGAHPEWQSTSPVGRFAPNGYGLYDMAGNMWEWCNDWYLDTYYSVSALSNPRGPATGSQRVVRGGAFRLRANGCRVANRRFDSPGAMLPFGAGFRICR